MKIKVITISNNDKHKGYLDLKNSLDKFGYDYEHIHAPFKFGTQMAVIYEWCKKNKDSYTHILYTDAFDTLALAPLAEIMEKLPKDSEGNEIVFFGSTEKNCYPHPELAQFYPPSTSEWKYVNAGTWICEIMLFIDEYEESHEPTSNDQDWLAKSYLKWLKNDYRVAIDTECIVFQSIAFKNDDDFSVINKRVVNNKTGSLPVFIHNNGGTHHVPTWVTDLIK